MDNLSPSLSPSVKVVDRTVDYGSEVLKTPPPPPQESVRMVEVQSPPPPCLVPDADAKFLGRALRWGLRLVVHQTRSFRSSHIFVVCDR